MLMIGKLTGAAALSLILWLSVDWPAAFAVLAGADSGALAVALAASMATILLSARKWQLLLRARPHSARLCRRGPALLDRVVLQQFPARPASAATRFA